MILTAAGGCQNSGGRHVNDVHLLAIAGLFTGCGEANVLGPGSVLVRGVGPLQR